MSNAANKLSPEIPARPVRMDHAARYPSRCAAVRPKARHDGRTPQPLNDWVKKADVIHRRRRWRSFEAVQFATLERLDGYNNLDTPVRGRAIQTRRGSLEQQGRKIDG